MANTAEIRKIMTKPLPEILDEIEDSIRLADEAAKNAREAAVEARKAGEKAAIEARKGSEKAIAEATEILNHRILKNEEAIHLLDEHIIKIKDSIKVEHEYIAKVERTAENALQIGQNALKLAELLKTALMDGVVAIDKRVSEKAPDIKEAPALRATRQKTK